MSTAACIARVQSVVSDKLGRNLSDAELDAVFRRADRFTARGKAKGHSDQRIESDLEQFAQDVISATIIQKRNAAFNLESQVRMFDTLETVYAARPDVGLEAMMMGIQRDVQGARNSIGRNIAAAQDQAHQAFHTDLARNGVDELFARAHKTELDAQIFRAMDQLHRREPKFDDIPPEAVTIAKVIDRHNEMMRVEGNKFGAWTKRERGYVTTRSHDPLRMAKNKEGWMTFMRSNLDVERTFPDKTIADIDKILANEYSQLVSGNHVAFRDPLVPTGFEGFGSTARQLSHERVFHFSTPDAEAKYLRDFGPGNLAGAVFHTLSNNSRDIAIMKQFGPNAKSNIESVYNRLVKKHDGDTETLLNLKAMKGRLDDSFWPTITGMGNTLGPGRGARIAATADHTVRSINRLSLLPFLLASQIPDIAIFASRVSRDGEAFTGGIIQALDGLLTGVSKAERMEVLSGLGVAVDGAIASVSRRLDVNDHMVGKLASTEQFMFKYTGSQWWTDRLRSKYAVTDAHMMAQRSTKAWKDLGADYQRALRQQGILPEEWAMLKHTHTTLGDGKTYVVPENVKNIPDSVIDAELRRNGITPTPRRRADFKTHTRDKLRGYFHDRAGDAVLEPDAKTRSFVTGGAFGRVGQQGSAGRVLTNQFFALKTFPLAILQRVMGAETIGRSTDLNATGASAFGEAFTNGSAFKGVAQLMVAGTVLGYASLAIKDMAKGRRPRKMNDEKAWLAAMLQGGGLGIYGDFLFGEGMKNRFGGNMFTTLGGPGVQDATMLADIIGKWTNPARGDEFDPAGDEMLRFVQNNMPFAGTGPIRTALDYMFLYELTEATNPGYLRRMERRMKRDNDQEFFLSPSSAAR